MTPTGTRPRASRSRTPVIVDTGDSTRPAIAGERARRWARSGAPDTRADVRLTANCDLSTRRVETILLLQGSSGSRRRCPAAGCTASRGARAVAPLSHHPSTDSGGAARDRGSVAIDNRSRRPSARAAPDRERKGSHFNRALRRSDRRATGRRESDIEVRPAAAGGTALRRRARRRGRVRSPARVIGISAANAGPSWDGASRTRSTGCLPRYRRDVLGELVTRPAAADRALLRFSGTVR